MRQHAKARKPVKDLKTERPQPKKPARALPADKDPYRILAEDSHEGIFIVQDGKLVFANKAFAAMVGYTAKSMIGLNFRRLVSPGDTDLAVKLKSGRRTEILDCSLVPRGGAKRVFVRLRLRPVRHGEASAVSGIVRDLSETGSVSEELKRSENRYRELYDNLRDGFAVMDLNGKIIEWNKGFRQMLGYSDREIPGLSSKKVTPRRWHKMEGEIVKHQVMARGYSDLYEKEYYRKDGSVLPVTLRTYLMHNEQGKRAKIWSFVRDITDQKRAMEALRRSEEKYRKLFEESRDAIAITDRDGTFLDVNKAMLELFGYRKEQLMKMRFQDLYAVPADAARFRHEIEKKGSLRDFEVMLLRKGGDVMHCLFTVSQKRSAQGKMAGYQGIVRDITAQKQMEEALSQSEKRYKELSITDDLTGLFNQRHFHHQLRKEIERVQRYKHPVALLLLDVDDFKVYNDTYGHLEGDKVLARLGEVIRDTIRKTDSGYRYGGEEFTVILTETGEQDAVLAAERLRAAFAEEIFSPAPLEEVQVTVSIGVAVYREEEDAVSFVKRADRNMYKAKSKGKNSVFFPG